MSRILAFLYGVLAYGTFFGTFLYAVGFVGNVAVPKSIDSGAEPSLAQALLINAVLLSIFSLQHSGMARQAFKRWWSKLVPDSVERSTYVLFSSLALILLFWQWRPMPGEIWSIENPIGQALLHALFAMGWIIVLLATFMINHFDLFGLRQVWLRLQGKQYTDLGFRTPGFYRYLRHPIQLGFLIAFWATPRMTLGHLLFAVATTGYILIALQLEEHDLMQFYGDTYRKYREQVFGLLPLRKYKGS